MVIFKVCRPRDPIKVSPILPFRFGIYQILLLPWWIRDRWCGRGFPPKALRSVKGQKVKNQGNNLPEYKIRNSSTSNCLFIVKFSLKDRFLHIDTMSRNIDPSHLWSSVLHITRTLLFKVTDQANNLRKSFQSLETYYDVWTIGLFFLSFQSKLSIGQYYGTCGRRHPTGSHVGIPESTPLILQSTATCN
jgi:hypothetical protein